MGEIFLNLLGNEYKENKDRTDSRKAPAKKEETKPEEKKIGVEGFFRGGKPYKRLKVICECGQEMGLASKPHPTKKREFYWKCLYNSCGKTKKFYQIKPSKKLEVNCEN